MEWLIKADPNKYNYKKAFEELECIDWIKCADFKVGDKAFIYTSAPVSAITNLVEVVKTNIQSHEKIDDKEYWMKESDSNTDNKLFARMKMIKEFEVSITLEDIQSHGLKGNIQGPRKLFENNQLTSWGKYLNQVAGINEKPRIIFCNIAYMKNYNGNIQEDIPQNGGKYVSLNKDAHEKINFKICKDNMVRGYVEVKHMNGKPNELHIENIDDEFKNKDEIDNVLVIFCAKSPTINKTVIVGWYKDATIYRKRSKYKDRDFNFMTSKENAYLLNEEDRIFVIPRASSNKDRIGFGQSNTWYANKDNATEIVNEVVDYVNNFQQTLENRNKLLIEDNPIEEEKHNMNISNNIILYGPPGTGKTYSTVYYAVAIIENKSLQEVQKEDYEIVLERYKKYKENLLIDNITFHQSYGYEEFIEGIKPVMDDESEDGDIKYQITSGIFKDICDRATNSTTNNQNYVFVIDEINRGNISKIFGELITLIEPSKRIGNKEEMYVKLPYSKKLFGVPNNVYIIGTMNTADRSISTIDTALRRRFMFVEMQPDTSLLEGVKVEGLDIKKMLDNMNKKIEALYDREHTIGHAYFMDVKNNPTIETLSQTFQNSILPLLQEYFYDDYEKIRLVLGDNKKTIYQFIIHSNEDYNKLFGPTDLDLEDQVEYIIDRGAFDHIESYRSI